MSEYTDCKYKYERIVLLRFRLASNLAWAMKGCQKIYEYQTADEQSTGETREHNNVGFSGADSYILSSFAEQINAGRFVASPKQREILFGKMPKYAKQLDGIAQATLNRTEEVRDADEEDPNRGNKS